MKIKLHLYSWLLLAALIIGGITVFVMANNSIISLSQKEYSVGDMIDIHLNVQKMDNVYVDILTPSSVYKFLNPQNIVRYRPNEPGIYRINVYNENELIESKPFKVATEESAELDYFTLNKLNYAVNEDVKISFNLSIIDESYRLKIKNRDKEFNYLSSLNSQLVFVPKQPGEYEIILHDDIRQIYTKKFTVCSFCGSVRNNTDADTPVNLSINVSESRNATHNVSQNFTQEFNITSGRGIASDNTLDIRDSQGYVTKVPYVVKQRQTQNASVDMSLNASLNDSLKPGLTLGSLSLNASQRSDITLYPRFAGIQKLDFNGIDYDNFDLGFEPLQKEKIFLPSTNVKKAFAIDPENLEFESAQLEVKAEGYRLMKCAGWNFDNQTCFGGWEVLQNIEPGQDYVIELSARDPAFAEVGLASINTEKPIYHNNEKVHFMIVVLDNSGYLVDRADVSLEIIDPGSVSYYFSTDSGSIVETSKGIYEGNFTSTGDSGIYDMNVLAVGDNVNNSMYSYFEVASYYEFEISRDAPITLDPYSELLECSINIQSYSGYSNFTYTESVPDDFSITDSDSDLILTLNNTRQLTWYGLDNNSTIGYKAQLPHASPELYELRGEIDYLGQSYLEARPWFVAADPSNTYYTPFASCSGWSDTTCCPGSAEVGECPVSGSATYSCTFTDTATPDLVPISVNVTVLDIWSVITGNLDVRLNGNSLGQTGFYGAACSNQGAATFSVSDLSDFNLAALNTVSLVPLGSGIHLISDSSGTGVFRIDVAYTLAPEVNQEAPADGAAMERGDITFSFNVSDDDQYMQNCSIWSDFSGSWQQGTNEGVIGETGSVDIENFEWHWIEFKKSYEVPPVVMATPVTQNGDAGDDDSPLIPTVSEVTTEGFNITICQDNGAATCDPTVNLETLHYFVFDMNETDNYDWIEVGTVTTATNGGDTTINFRHTFDNVPVVWTTTQTYNQGGNIAAIAWVEDEATKSTSSAPIIGCVHQGTGNSCTSGQPSEEIGYVAIDVDNVNLSSWQYGFYDIENSDWTDADFEPAYNDPRVMVTENDDDGGNDPEYAWARDVTSTGMQYRYCEADAADYCDGHTGEITNWFALEDGFITLPGRSMQTVYDVENGTTQNITLYLSPGDYNWAVRCFDVNGAEGWSDNRTLYITKPIDMFYPDRAAPGMNFVLIIIGEEFDSGDMVQTSSPDIVVGEIIVLNKTGYNVQAGGYAIQVPFFIKDGAANQNVTLNISRAVPPWKFEIIDPEPDSGNFTGQSGPKILGSGGSLGERSFFGTILLDDLVVPSGVTALVTTDDPDGNDSNGNQGYLPAIIMVDGIVNISGNFEINGYDGSDPYLDMGADGGVGGPGGGGGGAGGADNRDGGAGGDGYTGGGGGGTDQDASRTGGAGGDGTGGAGEDGSVSSGSGGRGGIGFSGQPYGGSGGSGSSDDGAGGAGGAGFIFGESGAGGGTGGASGTSGSGGGGGSADDDYDGGGGGFGSVGTDGTSPAAAGTGGSPYGSPQLVPLAGGAGGGGGGANSDGGDNDGSGAGGGGGGSLLIFSSRFIEFSGLINATGGDGSDCDDEADCGLGGGGSGGAVILQAPYVNISGTIDATGGLGSRGAGSNGQGGDGGSGRVRIDGLHTSSMGLTPDFDGSNFTGPAIYNISDGYINGTATPNTDISIVVVTQSGSVLSYSDTADANGWFAHNLTLPNGWNYISVVQNTSSNQVSMMSSPALVKFLAGSVPRITDVDCRVDNNWLDCSNAQYGTVLQEVRAECTVSGAGISNVSFALENVPDSFEFFSAYTTDNTTIPGWWWHNNANIDVEDSGYWNLEVVCTANNSVYSTEVIQWLVPWGSLSSNQLDPTDDKDVAQNSTFDYSTQLSCIGGECGDVNATLSIFSYWWNSSWRHRQRFNVTHTAENVTEYQMMVYMDTASLISEGKMRSDCADIRAVSSKYQELDFYVDEATGIACGTDNTLIWVQVDRLDPNVTNYFEIYYGNPSASSTSSIGDTFSYSEQKEIYFLVSENTDTAMAISSYQENNIITSNFNGETVVLDEGDVSIDFIDSDVSVGYSFNVTGAILSAATTVGTADVLSPISWAGTEFYDYRQRGGTGKEWLVYAPFADTTVDFWSATSAAASFSHLNTSVVGKRQWYKVTDADGSDGHTFKINSSAPILLAFEQGSSDVTIQYPATTDIWGVDGGDFTFGYDGTDYTLYDSDSPTLSRDADATDQILTGHVAQGSGSALHMNSSNLISGSATADSDGGDTYVFLPEYELEKQYYIPVTGQYIAGAATGETTCLVHHDGGTSGLWDQNNRTYPIPTKICYGYQCSGDGSSQYTNNKTNFFDIYANITCTKPFFAYYDDDDDDETNIYGRKSARQYTWPEPVLIFNDEETFNPAVNTTPGAVPFWTSSYNPITPTQDPCLRNMASGDTCDLDWIVNASGPINTTWEFFVDFFPYEYKLYLGRHESERINITIVDVVRPQVNNIECHQNGTSWVECAEIKFNEEIAAVRAQCSYDFASPPVNMSFWLENQDDSKTYFNNTSYDNSTGYWTLNLAGQTIEDSGYFNLYVDCYVDNGVFGYENVLWYVPYGSVGIDWFDPISDVNVTKDSFSNFSVTVSCTNGECKNMTAILDPLPVPFTIAAMDFESGTEFEAYTGGNGECSNHINVCDYSQFWDDFTNCIEGENSGLCYSPESAVNGNYGLLAQGSLDRENSPANDNALYIEINDSACGGNPCEEINISFWQSVASMDNSIEGSAVYVNDSDGTWVLVSDCMEGESCNDEGNDLAAADMSSVAEFVKVNICDLGVDCNDNLTIRFTSREIRSHGNADWFGWDDINITGYITKGVIPEDSGNPFYTSTSNPMDWTEDSCLINMTHQDTCVVTWEVNATGPLGSTHEFFAIVNSTNSFNNESQSPSIYVSIVGNLVPTVTAISLTPTGPISADDLFCNFTVADPNYFDILTVNVSWYLNDVFDQSSTFTVSNGVEASHKLGSGNTSLGQTWKCGVTPYDQNDFGGQVNSSPVTVLLSYPPIVSDIECYEDGSWGDCAQVVYTDTLEYVRANCTDIDGSVINATFNFTNIPDNNMFFSSIVTSGTDIYTYDNADIPVYDSGYFNLTVQCIDDLGVSGFGHVDWLVPWGTLQAEFEYPELTELNMTQNSMGQFRANVSCIGGECGNVTAVLDPQGQWQIAFIDFEAGTEFVLDPNACDTSGNAYCDDSEFWDDFTHCEEPAGGYGICSSSYMAVDGSRGLEFLGVDQDDAGNDGGLYIEIDSSTACNGYNCEAINISYYQAVGNLNSGSPEEGSAVFVNDSDGTRRLVSECMFGDSCSGSASSMWQVAEYVNVDLCSISGINCSESLTVHFTSRYARSQGTGDYFGWDTVNVTGFGVKGIIPMYSGSPFYTISQNPISPGDDSCLSGMGAGDNCTFTWLVNATGPVNTTHEIFAYFNATQYENYISKADTSIIDVTITENEPPYVTSIDIGPEYPLNATDLICNFTAHDPGFYDNMTVNITWYRDRIATNFSNMSITQDTFYQDILDSDDTEPGDVWHCGVRAYDGLEWGPETNSTNVTVLLYPPPAINYFECNANGAWGSCSNVGYYDNLSAVRVNCTSSEGMTAANMSLINIPDYKLYFGEYLVAPEDWADEEYSSRKQINITNVAGEDLIDFPVFLNISYESEMQEDYDDVFFVPGECSEGNTNKLSYDIDHNDSTNAYLWLKMENLSSSGSSICMYYGNPSAFTNEDSVDVWTNSYEAVWHFGETGSTTDRLDATGNGYNGDPINYDDDEEISGRVGGADTFDGTSDYLAVRDLYYASQSIEELTVCTWFRTSFSGSAYNDNWAFLDYDRSEYFDFYIRGDNGALEFSTTGGSTNDHSGTITGLNDGTWHFGCAVYDGDDKIIYVDGSEDNRVNNAHLGANLGTSNVRYGFIGEGSEADTFAGATNGIYYDGDIDELRYSSVGRTEGWIDQSYQVIADHWNIVDYGIEEVFTVEVLHSTPAPGTLSGDFFVVDHNDLNITDSGEFILSAVCLDSANQTVSGSFSWDVPWGTLTTTLISPDSDTNVEYHQFFTFDAAVSCGVGECGNVTATLDPYIKSSTYDFTSGYQDDKTARRIDSNDNPPTSINLGQSYDLSTAQIDQINVSDDVRFATGSAGGGDYVSLDMAMTIEEDVSEILNVTLFFNGQPDQTNDMQIYAWNTGTSSWDVITSQVIPADTDRDMEGVIDGANLPNYLDSNNQIRWSVVNDLTNSQMRVDYVKMDVTFNAYKGILSTVPGAIPFYTIDMNPKDWTNQTCLANMTAGKTCEIQWNVNTTGPIGSTHEFFVYSNASEYSPYIAGDESTHIFITITNESNVPPIVILQSPANDTHSNDFPVFFNCSATDNSGLKNMTLYTDFTGIFEANETQNISGTANSSLFSKVLQDGIYMWNCLGFDRDGNFDWGAYNRTLTFDTVPPEIRLYEPSNGSTLTESALTFNFTSFDQFSEYMICDLYFDEDLVDEDITVYNNTIAESTITNVQVDEHNWYVECIDRAGNVNETSWIYFEVIDLPPNVTLVTENNTFFNTSNITLEYIPEDNRGINTSYLLIDGVINQTTDGPVIGDVNQFNVTNLDEGYYYWTVNVTDSYNLSFRAPERRFAIDYTPPNITLIYPTTNITTNNSETNISFNVTDNLDEVLSCNITVNGVVRDAVFDAPNSTVVTRNISNLPDGSNLWDIICWDGALNRNATQTFEIEVLEPPRVQLDAPPSGYSQSQAEVNLYYTPTDNTGFLGCDLYVDGIFNKTNTTGIVNGIQNSFTLDSVGEGNYQWSVNCTDIFNISTMTDSWNFTVDFTEPTIELLRPQPAELWLGRQTNFNFSVIDNLDDQMICNITVDSIIRPEAQNILASNNTPVNQTVNVSNEGYHYWNVTCVDNAGNENTSLTWQYETRNPPEITLIFPYEGDILNYDDIEFEYLPFDEDLNSTFLILNDELNQSNTTVQSEEYSYFNVQNMSNGYWNWTVNATDNSNLSVQPSPYSFIIDTFYPQATLNHPFNTEVISTNNVTFNFTAWDNLDPAPVCNVTVNGTLEFVNLSVTSYSEVLFTRSFPDGVYDWFVECADHAYNSWTSGYHVFTVEAPPNVTLVQPPNDTRTTADDITFEYLPYDPYGIENCTLYLDAQPVKNSTTVLNGEQNSFDVQNITEGLHNWTVECLDAAPDYNSYSPAPFTFRIDVSGPGIVLNYPPVDETLNLNNVTFNYTAYDSDDVVIDCNITVSDFFGQRVNATSEPHGVDHIIRVDNLIDGEHYWNVTCVDDLGNSNISVTQRFVINQPDLYLDNSRVWLSNDNPDLGENITIYANVSNIGGNPASNAPVDFFDGNPALGGSHLGQDVITIGINQSQVFSTTWIFNRTFHTIWIVPDYVNTINELNETNNNATLNISALWANITDPLNNTWHNNLNLLITMNITDYTGGAIDYMIYVDDTFNGESGTATDGVLQNHLVTFTEGINNLYVEVNDSLDRIKRSPGLDIFIDVTDPEVSWTTVNDSWFNYSQPQIMFTITDNMDTEINYTMYIDGEVNYTGSATDSISESTSLPPLPTGFYELIVEARDEAGNRKNSTPIWITVDLQEPGIVLNAIPDSTSLFTNETTLNFSVYDNYDGLLHCNLTIDNSVVWNDVSAPNNNLYPGSSNSTFISGLGEGDHYWNVSCWDGNSVSPIVNINTSETRIFTVFLAPRVTLVTPEDMNWTNLENTTFYFEAEDDTGLENCSLLINDAVVQTKTTGQLLNGGINNFTETYMEGGYNWSVQCFDTTAQSNYARSENRTLYVDLVDPDPYIETEDSTWFNYNNPLIFFNITDNMDPVLNYTFFVNGSANAEGNVTNATSSSVNLDPLADSFYTLELQASDEAGNFKNSSAISIYVDTVEPTITLIKPEDDNETTDQNIFFNFTAADNLATQLICNLTIDGGVNATIPLTPGDYNVTNFTLGAGHHYWNVTCIDNAGNINTSETYHLLIPLPDVAVFASDITFNTTWPEENRNITINATIRSLGETPLENIIVQFFEGHYSLENQISSNYTINLSVGENRTLNVSWLVPGIGTKTIFVVTDPPIATEGKVTEFNETNNVANNSIDVSSYTFAYGNLSGLTNIQDINNYTLYQWNISAYNSTKIYVADFDSSIDWASLQALSRTTAGAYTSDDFADIDAALSMQSNTDSVNSTWLLNNAPRYTASLDVFRNTITDIPMVNSTQNSNFMTGILWDTSDTGAEYTGTQDLVFVTRVNMGQAGQLGTYDYELKVPANLRLYQNPNTATVTFYTELP